MALARYLADKSALARATKPTVAAKLEPLLAEGAVATCAIVMLEVLYSARSAADYGATRTELDGLDRIELSEMIFERALEVQAELASAAQHRGVPLPDLMIAAAAELSGLTVLHYDADFDVIAAVTGQTVEWIVERGTAD